MNDSLLKKYEPKECPRCNKNVVCTGDMNCWCLSIKIPELVQEHMTSRYEGCLCRECIEDLCKKIDCENKNRIQDNQ